MFSLLPMSKGICNVLSEGKTYLDWNLSGNVQTGSQTLSVCPARIHPTLAEFFQAFLGWFCPSPQCLCHSGFLNTCYVQGSMPVFITFSSQSPTPGESLSFPLCSAEQTQGDYAGDQGQTVQSGRQDLNSEPKSELLFLSLHLGFSNEAHRHILRVLWVCYEQFKMICLVRW